jgi:thiol-disulfide isomerase/thioredoxin
MKGDLRPILYPIVFILFNTFFFLPHSFGQRTKVKIIESKNLRTFDQVIKLDQFKDKVTYVDLWGVHCIPCIEEFQFNSKLKDHFKNQPVEYLYIAVDYGHPDDGDIWKKMIQDKNLVGFNLIASNELYKNIWQSLKDSVETMYLVPHYIIVNKKGGISFGDAARPSANDTLYNQIQSVLNN